jgi:hypothetical protein
MDVEEALDEFQEVIGTGVRTVSLSTLQVALRCCFENMSEQQRLEAFQEFEVRMEN